MIQRILLIFPPPLLNSLHFELSLKVIEQKYVDFLMGPGGNQCEMHSDWATIQCENPRKTRTGQSLAAINHAAGVNVILDQTHKFSGYSHAKIFGPEEMVTLPDISNAVFWVFRVSFNTERWSVGIWSPGFWRTKWEMPSWPSTSSCRNGFHSMKGGKASLLQPIHQRSRVEVKSLELKNFDFKASFQVDDYDSMILWLLYIIIIWFFF